MSAVLQDNPVYQDNVPSVVPDDRSVRRRQYLLLGGIIAAVLAAFYGYVRWMDYQNKPPENPKKTISNHRLQVPGQGLNEKEVWMATEGVKMKTQQNQIEELLRWKQSREDADQKAPGNSGAPGLFNPPRWPQNPVGGAFDFNPAKSLPPPGALPLMSAGSVNAAPAATGFGSGTKNTGGVPGAGVPLPPPLPDDNLVHISFADSAPSTVGAEGHGKAVNSKSLDNYVPAGSFGKAIILGGLDAPAGGQAQSEPHPVLLMFNTDWRLPNRFRSRVKECHAIGAGYGDISSERAYIRVTTLSCVTADRQVHEIAIKGLIFGEDGKYGLRGKLVTKQGQLLAKVLLAGVASGLGQSLAQSTTTLSINPLGATSSIDPGKALEHGGYAGVGKTLDRLGQYYLTLAEKTFPVVEISANREVEIVLEQGFEMDVGETSSEDDEGEESR